MRTTGKFALIAFVTMSPITSTSAQDFSMIGSSVSGITMPQVLNPCPNDRCTGASGHPEGGLAMRAMRVSPSPAATAAPLDYSASPALKKRILEATISRTRRTNPQAAQAVQDMFARYDYTQIYEGVAKPYGLGGNDVANVMSACFILGWIIANGRADVPGGAAAVHAVHAQFASELSHGLSGGPQGRAELGEQMKILFAVMHAGWQGAAKEHSQRAYAEAIERQFRQQAGVDLRAMSLDSAGFGRRAS